MVKAKLQEPDDADINAKLSKRRRATRPNQLGNVLPTLFLGKMLGDDDDARFGYGQGVLSRVVEWESGLVPG